MITFCATDEILCLSFSEGKWSPTGPQVNEELQFKIDKERVIETNSNFQGQMDSIPNC